MCAELCRGGGTVPLRATPCHLAAVGGTVAGMNQPANDAPNGTTGDLYANVEPAEQDAHPDVLPGILSTDQGIPRRARIVEPDGSPVSPFGGAPAGVSRWGARRKLPSGSWEPMSYGKPGATTADRDWPIADLSDAEIQRRWGAGTYEIQWVKPAANGGRYVMRGGRQVEILPPPPAPNAPPVAAAPVRSSVDEHLEFMGIVEERSSKNLRDVLQLAQFFGRQQQTAAPPAITIDGLRLLMREERDAAAAATTAAIAASEARMAAMFEELTEDDDDAAGALASEVAPKLFKGGNKWWQQIGALLADNPELVKAVAPVFLTAVENVTGAVKAAVAVPKPAPLRPRILEQPGPRPHVAATVAAVQPPTPAPAVPPVSVSPPDVGPPAIEAPPPVAAASA